MGHGEGDDTGTGVVPPLCGKRVRHIGRQSRPGGPKTHAASGMGWAEEPAELESKSSLTQGILAPSYRGEVRLTEGRTLSEITCHAADGALGWSLNPGLFAPETWLSP